MTGGSLGPDLTSVYLRYQDKALTAFLRRPCLRWDPGARGDAHLTPGESFAVKAFLRDSALPQATARATAGATGTAAADDDALATAPPPHAATATASAEEHLRAAAGKGTGR